MSSEYYDSSQDYQVVRLGKLNQKSSFDTKISCCILDLKFKNSFPFCILQPCKLSCMYICLGRANPNTGLSEGLAAINPYAAGG